MRKLITSVPIIILLTLAVFLPAPAFATNDDIYTAANGDGDNGNCNQGESDVLILIVNVSSPLKDDPVDAITLIYDGTTTDDIGTVYLRDSIGTELSSDDTPPYSFSGGSWAETQYCIHADIQAGATPGNTVDFYIADGAISDTGDGNTGEGVITDTDVRTIVAVDNSPPCAISDLTALVEGSTLGGRIKVKWTAPGDDGTGGGNASKFLVKYATKYISSDNFYASWVSTWGLFSTSTAAGLEESHILTGFDEGTTYYFAIMTRDEKPNWSVWPGTSTNVNSLSFTVPTDSAPATITSLSALTGSSGGEIDLDWLAPGDDGTIGNITNGMWRIKYSSNLSHTWDTMSYTLDISTSATYGLKYSTTIAGLSEGVTYYFYIKAGDEKPNWSGLSNKATAMAKITPPPTPTTVVISQIGVNYDDTAAPDYLELYNTTNEPIDLSAASVQRGTGDLGTITRQNLSGTIPAYGFYLIGDEDAVTPVLLYPLTPDTTHSTWVISDDNWVAYVSNQTDVDAIKKINDPDVVDWVGLGANLNKEGSGTATNPGVGYCERLSQFGDSVADLQDGGSRALFGNSYDTNDNADNFVRTTLSGHPKSKPQNSESPHEIPSTPTISGFTPDTGPVGTTVTIKGTYFGAVRKSSNTYSHIYFYNGVEADYTIGDFVWCDTKVVVGVPAGAETGKIWFCTQDDFSGHTGTSTVNFTIGTADSTPPAAISDLTALAEGSTLGGRITVKWSEPGDDGESNDNSAGQYLVKYSSNYISSSDFYAAWVSTWGYYTPGAVPGAEISKVLTGFLEGTTYFFAIRTKDSDDNWSVWPGTSTNVNSLSFNVPTDSAPLTITSLSALTGSSGGEIDLTWLVPGDDGTIGNISNGTWRIKYSSDSTHTWDTMSYTLDISTSVSYGLKCSTTLAGLNEGATYYFYIKAGDEKPNWSGLSNKATAQAYTTPDSVPPCAISDLTALTGSDDGEVTLKWTAPGDDGTSGDVSGGTYRIRAATYCITSSNFGDVTQSPYYTYSIDISTSYTTWGGEHSYTMTGLYCGTTYYFAVKLEDEESNLASWSCGSVNKASTAPACDLNPKIITDLAATAGSLQVTLSWTEPSGEPDLDYYTFYRDSTTPYDFGDAYTFNIDTGNVSKEDTGLEGGVTYYYRVETFDYGNGASGLFSVALSSAYSNVVSTAPTSVSAPGAITNLTGFMGSAKGECVLSWTAPGDNGYSGDIGSGGFYTVKYDTWSVGADYAAWWVQADTFTISAPLAQGSDEYRVITGLTGGTTYWFAVKTTNESSNQSAIDENAEASGTQAWAVACNISTHVVISEFFYDEDGTDNNEFIELYNPTNEAIDISSWYVEECEGDGLTPDHKDTIPASQQIPPYGFYLIGEKDPLDSLDFGGYSISPDVDRAATDWEQGPDAVRLMTSGDVYVDGLSYNYSAGTDWGWADDPGNTLSQATGDSLERKARSNSTANGLAVGGQHALIGHCEDSDSNESDFVKRLVPRPQSSESPHEIPYAPTIVNFSPMSGAEGTTVTIKGTFFGAVRVSSDAYSHIYFYNGVEADYTIGDFVWCDTKVVVGVPAGATTGKIWMGTQDDFEGHTGTSTVNFVISVGDATPPAAISDLTALEGSVGGEVKLKWTAPGDNGMTDNITGGAYKIKYSSVAIITENHFDSPPASYTVTTIDISTDTTPGDEHSKSITGLLEGTSYWFAIITEDDSSNWAVWNSSSDVSTVNLLAYSCPKDSAPAAITNLSALTGSSGGEIDLTWSVPGDDGWTGAITDGKYRLRYSTIASVDWTTASSGWTDFDDKYELELDTDTSVSGETHSRTRHRMGIH